MNIQLTIDKDCGACGKNWRVLPKETKLTAEGFWWDCHCKSTLFTSIKNFKDHMEDLENLPEFQAMVDQCAKETLEKQQMLDAQFAASNSK